MNARSTLIVAGALGGLALLWQTLGADSGFSASKGEKGRAGEPVDPGAHRPVAVYLTPEHTESDRQSPINILTTRAEERQHKASLHYRSSKEHIVNLGHTIEVDWDRGSSIEFDGDEYDLVQFHFHTPAEHLLDGMTYPMEVHLVHQARKDETQLLVVGALFKEGTSNPILERILPVVPRHAGEHLDLPDELDLNQLFERDSGYYHYAGSMTTPPYSEVVKWLVLDGVHEASPEQIEAIAALEGDNARHIQEPRARAVEHCRFAAGSPQR